VTQSPFIVYVQWFYINITQPCHSQIQCPYTAFLLHV